MGQVVYVLDDEKSVLDMLKMSLELEFENLEVQIALSAGELEKLMSDKKPDLIVVDLMLPGIYGDRLAREYRKKYPDLPIIMYTCMPEELTEETKNEFPYVVKDNGKLLNKLIDVYINPSKYPPPPGAPQAGSLHQNLRPF